MNKAAVICLFCCGLLAGCQDAVEELDLGSRLQPVPRDFVHINPDYHIWGASTVKGEDGKYHMFYSRWPFELGHMGWVTDSEIAYAIADNPEGPYRFVNVALPKRGFRLVFDCAKCSVEFSLKQIGRTHEKTLSTLPCFLQFFVRW